MAINIVTLFDGGGCGIFENFNGTSYAAVVSDDISRKSGESVLSEMNERISAVRKEFRRGDPRIENIRNYSLCIINSLDRLPVFFNLFEKIRGYFSPYISYMDIVVCADVQKKTGEEINNIIYAMNGEPRLSVFYTEDMTTDDIKGVCANILENRLKEPVFSEYGFYLMRTSVGTMGNFQLFLELSARRLEEDEKKAKFELSAADMRDFSRKKTDETFKKLDRQSFRYILWNKNFHDKFEEADSYRDRDPFAENVKKFIALNCSDSFYKYMEEARGIDGQFCRLFWNQFAGNFEELIGRSRIETMGDALSLLRQIKEEIEREKNGVSINTGRKASINDKENLWAYSDYMYENYFKHKMELERFSCELEFIDAFYTEIDKEAINEGENLAAFNKMINEKRDKDNRFAQAVYDKISELFKCNSNAESSLIEYIKEYLNSLTVSDSDSSVYRALFAGTAEEFRILMENRVNIIFARDIPEKIKDDFNGFAREQLSPPDLLIATPYESVKQGLDLAEPVLTSFKPFEGYGGDIAKFLEDDANMVALYEYYRINTRDSNIVSMLAKII